MVSVTPVPTTDERSQVRQNTAIQQILSRIQTGANTPSSITSGHAITSLDSGKTLFLSGGGNALIKSLTLGAASGFSKTFQVRICNADSRGWLINITGFTDGPFIIWPAQTRTIFNDGTAWHVDPSSERWKPVGPPTFFVNATSGNDTNDGLSTGTAAFRTIQAAVDNVHTYLDPTNFEPSIQLEDGTHNVGTGVLVVYPMASTQLRIVGNTVTPTSVIIKPSAGGAAFNVQEPATLTVGHFKIDGSNGGCTGITLRQFATCDVGDITFTNFTGGITIQGENHSSIGIVGDLTWVGNFAVAIALSDHSFLSCTTNTYNVPAVTCTIFLEVVNQSIYVGGGPVIDAGLIGQKYLLNNLSLVTLNGSIMPGTVAGSPVAGGALVSAGLVTP